MDLDLFEMTKTFCQLIELHNGGMVWNPQEIENFFSVHKLGPAEEDFVNHCIVQWMHHLSAVKRILNLHWDKLTLDEKTSQPFMDANLIEALLYLIIFESESFPAELYEQLICQFSCFELFKLLQFLSENLDREGLIFQSLLQIYDSSYIQDKIMEPLTRQRNFLMNLSKNMKPFVTKKKHHRLTKSLTVFKPFNLTKPRARSIPVPESVNRGPQAALAVPPTTYVQPQIFFRLQEKMIENKRKAKKLLEDIRSNHSHYQKSEKSERTLKRMAEILDEQEQQLQFNKWKTVVMPPIFKEEPCPVRKNITTILREGIYVQKELQDQLSKIKQCESGSFAHFSVHRWFEKINAEEIEEKKLRDKALYEKHRLCLEDVKSAKRKSAKDKHQKVEKMQNEKQQLLKELKRKEIQKEHEIKEVVDKIVASRRQMKANIRDVAKLKRQQAKEQQADYEEQKTKAEEISREEMDRRKATIEQIRTFELLKSMREEDTRHKRRNCLESSADFMQKLNQAKAWQQEMESTKRKEIEEQKRSKKEQLEEIQRLTRDFKSSSRSPKQQIILSEKKKSSVLRENMDLQALQRKTDAAKKKLKQTERGSGKKEQDLKLARQQLRDLALNGKTPLLDFCLPKD